MQRIVSHWQRKLSGVASALSPKLAFFLIQGLLMDLDLSDKKNTYIYPLIEDAEVGQLITTGKYILEVVEIDRSQQLMIVQKVV